MARQRATSGLDSRFFSSQSMKYRHAAEAASSTEWMLPSTQNAGLSAPSPVSLSVSVMSGISRPSKLRPAALRLCLFVHSPRPLPSAYHPAAAAVLPSLARQK